MYISAFDSRMFRNLFGTEEIRRIFTDEAYAQYLVHTEAALARAESMVGVIPRDAGAAITAALDTVKLDFERLSQETEIVGYPVLPLVMQLVQHTPEAMGKYIHWGATTQDIMDVASMLKMKEGLKLVERELDTLIEILTSLSEKHRDTLVGHLQT
ncbi:hypothetical protein SI65_01487 [Aspergillus cristatus]|uniref:Fumarate lyase N-terminal domain-containing protein n=1 Tax=Aspergillus cristatus TaxID=573508 RepID=A0A1E3BSP3_ASPCR|nr:hypothetical protein SI65_01487 [Aspergillus cristatus]